MVHTRIDLRSYQTSFFFITVDVFILKVKTILVLVRWFGSWKVAKMSDCSTFRTQLASIMEVLANTAVAEICQLVDDGYAVLHLEMSRSYKENEVLKRKLKLLESSAPRMRAKRAALPRNSPGIVAQDRNTLRGRIGKYYSHPYATKAH